MMISFFRTIVVSMGLVLLLSHDLQGTEKGLLLIKGFAEQDFTNYSLDSKLGALYNGNENNTDTTNAEVSHIGFLKVHKAGSTTMQNMLFRFGLKRNLTFVIPKSRNLYRNSVNTLPVKRGGHYDILAVHIKAFYKGLFDEILSHDKVNIATVREPLDRMISTAYYYRSNGNTRYLLSIPENHLIQNLIDHPEKYDKKFFSQTKNARGKDFGFKTTTRESDIEKNQERLEFLDNEFRLVLVLERFEESLVLMKRYLGWQMADIVHIPTNTRQHLTVNLTEKQKIKHKRTCFLDYAIYNFFSQVLDQKVQAEGPGFQDEVRYFRSVLQQLRAFCIQTGTDTEKLIIKASKWNSEFQVPKSDCELMRIPEKNVHWTLKNTT